MNRKPSKKVQKAFELLRKHPQLSIQDAALNAGCTRSAIYRSTLYPAYLAAQKAEASK